MKKLKLNLDDLKVESFNVVSSSTKKGTVLANAPTWINDPTCAEECDTEFLNPCGPTDSPTCDSTCQSTCYNTCGYSCNGTCNNTCFATCRRTCDQETCWITCD